MFLEKFCFSGSPIVNIVFDILMFVCIFVWGINQVKIDNKYVFVVSNLSLYTATCVCILATFYRDTSKS